MFGGGAKGRGRSMPRGMLQTRIEPLYPGTQNIEPAPHPEKDDMRAATMAKLLGGLAAANKMTDRLDFQAEHFQNVPTPLGFEHRWLRESTAEDGMARQQEESCQADLRRLRAHPATASLLPVRSFNVDDKSRRDGVRDIFGGGDKRRAQQGGLHGSSNVTQAMQRLEELGAEEDDGMEEDDLGSDTDGSDASIDYDMADFDDDDSGGDD